MYVLDIQVPQKSVNHPREHAAPVTRLETAATALSHSLMCNASSAPYGGNPSVGGVRAASCIVGTILSFRSSTPNTTVHRSVRSVTPASLKF